MSIEHTWDDTVAPPKEWGLDEPIEVRMANARLRDGTLVLWASVTEHGTIRESLAYEGHGTSESLRNIQAKTVFPRKAVPGWQHEVIAFCESSLYDITEVR